MKKNYLAFEDLTALELDALNREKTVFLLSVSLLEEHGPHLPFGVDVFVAEFMAEKLMDEISENHNDFTIVKFPPLHVGSGGIRWLGTINSKQRTMRKIVYDYCSHLGKHGFKYVLLSNGHGGLGHVVALEEAARKCSRKYNMSVISPSGNVAFNLMTGEYIHEIEAILGSEFSEQEKENIKNDSHAGWWETSVMLLMKPHLVKDSFKKLEPYVLTRGQRMRNKVYPGDQGFRGYPAKATKEYAQAVVDVMVKHTMELVNEWLAGKDMKKKASSPLYNMLFFRTNFDRTVIFSVLIIFVIICYFVFR
ncbi:MAG: creatininase family protein [Calditrichaeota bacterium]|nr:MAG: creatininase family protein [Calditrichota bacterium]MBL1205939.1 creatininase family protein [Calditrichota bacterium]NOG45767.1 creatininase family protein [Calditrichota bacterium]